jgi:hypothetical protein
VSVVQVVGYCNLYRERMVFQLLCCPFQVAGSAARGDVKHRDSGQFLTNYPKVSSFIELTSAVDREMAIANDGNSRIT